MASEDKLRARMAKLETLYEALLTRVKNLEKDSEDHSETLEAINDKLELELYEDVEVDSNDRTSDDDGLDEL